MDYVDEVKGLESVVAESITKQREQAGVPIKDSHFTIKEDRAKSKKLAAEDPEYLEADKLLNQANKEFQDTKKELIRL